jgi:hypothetical protein
MIIEIHQPAQREWKLTSLPNQVAGSLIKIETHQPGKPSGGKLMRIRTNQPAQSRSGRSDEKNQLTSLPA